MRARGFSASSLCAMARHRALGFGLAAIVILFLAVKLLPAPAGTGRKVADGFVDAPFGAFAGYTWLGTAVESVGASFTVPRIAGGSPLSEAGTWIGVQGQGPPARFVQI